ncbi:hypothetical protein [Pararhizobium qamdonense]|uniref:hypothetical protein n=1 Tax=Pararhizobium qamdonense TaxID=3031126 RepID=UPI0023E140D8|nr:hypothetical protein [Pararhizobium qamdonense]
MQLMMRQMLSGLFRLGRDIVHFNDLLKNSLFAKASRIQSVAVVNMRRAGIARPGFQRA